MRDTEDLLPRDRVKRELEFVLDKISANLEAFAGKFPAPVSTGGVYAAMDNTYWTTAFWTGMLWLAYEVSGEEKYRREAERQVASFRRRVEERIETNTHDLGFLYTLSCVAGYKLTGDEETKATALKAADLLLERYWEKAGIIQAWGDPRDPEQQGRMIVDCLMNLPLLYWAAGITGEARYYDAAYSHARNAARYLVREDDTTYHTYFLDVATGAPRGGKTCQGLADDSCWARGQAWGIYGFALSYLHTGDRSLRDTGKRLADYFLSRLPEDRVCYWDLVFTGGNEERDSSGAVIAACGLLETAKHLPESDADRRRYRSAAASILASLAEGYTTKDRPDSNGILLHAVYDKPKGKGVDECCIWGDYFYLEALVRLDRDWRIYW